MNAVKIIQNLCVKLRQLLVQTDDPVSLAFAAFFLVRTAAAILALKIFLGSAVFIAPYRPAVNDVACHAKRKKLTSKIQKIRRASSTLAD